MRALHGLRPRVEPLESIVVPGEVERMFGPLPVDDLELLGQNRHPLTHRREREAVRGVLALEPAGPDAELDAAAGDVVRRDHGLGQHARVAKRRGRDESPDAQRGRDRAQRRHGAPGVERATLGVLVDGEVVVGAEERVEAEPLARLRERDPVGPRRAPLPPRPRPSRPTRRPPGLRSLGRSASALLPPLFGSDKRTTDRSARGDHAGRHVRPRARRRRQPADGSGLGPLMDHRRYRRRGRSAVARDAARAPDARVEPHRADPRVGVACVRAWIDWESRTLRDHAVAIVVFQPLIALGLWVSGGVDSYLGPILVLPTLYVAYFFPPRYAWPLAVIEIATYCSPFLYSATDHPHLLLGRAVMYAAAYAGLVATIQYLKSHLVAAERVQRRMAHEDPLTGLPNRRSFGVALDASVAAGRPFSLLLVDVDHFKAINDTFGHTTGDRVLREIAARTRTQIRATDTLARIGGDELALVAPDASAAGADRLASALHAAVAGLLPADGAAPVTLTISRSSFPDDGVERDELLRAADRRLHEVKDERAVGASRPSSPPGFGAPGAFGAA